MLMPRAQVQEIINRFIHEPVKAQEEIEAFLSPLFDRGAFCEPLSSTGVDQNIEYGITGYQEAARIFSELGFVASAEAILLRWWNKLSRRQFDERVWIYKAISALFLTQHYLRLNDKGTAQKWALLTHADDMIGQKHIGLGRDYLLTVFGVSPNILDEIRKITEECREGVEKQSNNWSLPQGFAEEIFYQVAMNKTASSLLGEACLTRQFPLSPAYYSSLIKKIDATTEGDALEKIAVYLLSLLSGCVPRSKVLAQQNVGESDIVVHNFAHDLSLNSDLFGRHFLVECKNWNEKTVGVPQVGYFLYRMRLMKSKFGIIFTRRSISGSSGDRAAVSLISRAFNEDGTICINVTLKDLKSLMNQDQTLWWMLMEKIESVRFGKPRFKEITK